MALEIQFTDGTGTKHEKCYCKISKINSSFNKSHSAKVDIDMYHDKQAKESKFNTIGTMSRTFDNPVLTQIDNRKDYYQILKNDPDFKNALDV